MMLTCERQVRETSNFAVHVKLSLEGLRTTLDGLGSIGIVLGGHDPPSAVAHD